MEATETDRVLACRDCGTTIESCMFCDGEECAVAICYRCVRIALERAQPEPRAPGD